MTTTAWAHLPNAPHIDRVLADLKARPQVWEAARVAALDAAWDATRAATRAAARAAVRDDAWIAALDAAWIAALDAAWIAALDAARDAALGAAWGACTALIAWDDCAHLLDQPVDAVRFLAANGHNPAILLLPAVIALNTKE